MRGIRFSKEAGLLRAALVVAVVCVTSSWAGRPALADEPVKAPAPAAEAKTPAPAGEAKTPAPAAEAAAATGAPTSAPTVPAVPASQPAALAGPAAAKAHTCRGPYDDKWDWIMLTSKEWLKGAIEGMRDDSLKFDSDEMDDQTFDWEDVAEVHSPKVHTYVLDDLTQVVGKATITPKTVTITTDTGIKTFPRKNLLGIIPGIPSELNWWAAKLKAGASIATGNTEQVNYNASARIRREDAYTRGEATYDGAFGKASGVENQNRHVGDIKLDVFLSRRFFITAITSSFTYDKFLNIAFRAIPGAGVGYTAIKNKWVDWDLIAGAGYQFLSNISVEEGADDPQHDAAITLRTRVEFDITGDIDLDLDWTTVLVPTSMGLTNHKGVAELSIEITDIFDFDVSATYTRFEDPATRADGSVPVKDDLMLVLGIGLDFGYD